MTIFQLYFQFSALKKKDRDLITIIFFIAKKYGLWTELRSFTGKRIVNWSRSRKKGSTLTLHTGKALHLDGKIVLPEGILSSFFYVIYSALLTYVLVYSVSHGKKIAPCTTPRFCTDLKKMKSILLENWFHEKKICNAFHR